VNRKRTPIAGVLGGLVHFAIVGGLYAYLRGPELFGYSTYANSFFGLSDPVRIYVLLGAILLGAVPVLMWVEHRLVTPTVTIVAIVVSILLFSPAGLERATGHGGPLSMFGFYFMFWFAPLIVATVVGGLEYGARQLRRKNPTDNGQSTSGGGPRE
jgi:hypothetical protein